MAPTRRPPSYYTALCSDILENSLPRQKVRTPRLHLPIFHLFRRMRAQRAAPSVHHPSASASYIPRDLLDASMVFVRHDGVKRPLQNPYDGPFPILESGEKSFKILRNGLPYTVSIDRLKPCNSRSPQLQSSLIPNHLPPPLPTSL